MYLYPLFKSEKEVIPIVQVIVQNENIEGALRVLKKKMQREGLFREMKERRHFEPNSEKNKRRKAEAVRRARKDERKRREKQGF